MTALVFLKTSAVLRVLCVSNLNAEDAKGRGGKLRNPFTAKAQSTAHGTWAGCLSRLGAHSGLGNPGMPAVAVGGAGAHGEHPPVATPDPEKKTLDGPPKNI